MSQQFPTTPQVVYDTLVADATFMSFIGQYTFTAGSVLSAISIVSPGQDLPGLKKITGLECVIHDAADVKRTDYLDSSETVIDWRVFLISWGPSNGYTMTQAAQRLVQIFGGARTFETVAVADGLGALAQTMAQIPSNQPILPH